MSEFMVISTQLRQKAEELRQLNSSFNAAVESLVSSENALTQMWEGEAHDAFHTEFEKDHEQFNVFHEGIEQYIQALLDAAQKYEEAESKNLSIAQTRKA